MPAQAQPGFDEVRANWRSSDWVLLSRDGEPLARTRVDKSARRGDWIALSDVSPALREAIVVSEDRRFYQHAGVDYRTRRAEGERPRGRPMSCPLPYRCPGR